MHLGLPQPFQCREETGFPRNVLDQSERHPDAGAAKSDVPVNALAQRTYDEGRNKRTDIDPHVEDREPRVPPFIILVVERSDHRADVRLQEPCPHHD